MRRTSTTYEVYTRGPYQGELRNSRPLRWETGRSPSHGDSSPDSLNGLLPRPYWG